MPKKWGKFINWVPVGIFTDLKESLKFKLQTSHFPQSSYIDVISNTVRKLLNLPFPNYSARYVKNVEKRSLRWGVYGHHAHAKYLLKALIFGKEHINIVQDEISAQVAKVTKIGLCGYF